MWDAFQYDFMQNALWAGLLAAVACGIIGVYVVVNRIVFMAGGIAHAAFGGVGIGIYAGISPILGALYLTSASAIGMGLIIRKTRLPTDTAIGVLWAMGFALGILLIELASGYRAQASLEYLFGDILLVPDSDLPLLLVLDIVIVTVVVALYKELLAMSFDEEFGTVAGVPVQALYLLLLCMIALTVVILVRVVGIILVIAFLTIPAALARRLTHDIKKMMLLATLFGALFTIGGLCLSYEFDVPSGATIVLLSGSVFLTSFGLSAGIRRLKGDAGPAEPQR